jgi:hypothetical protein
MSPNQLYTFLVQTFPDATKVILKKEMIYPEYKKIYLNILGDFEDYFKNKQKELFFEVNIESARFVIEISKNLAQVIYMSRTKDTETGVLPNTTEKEKYVMNEKFYQEMKKKYPELGL